MSLFISDELFDLLIRDFWPDIACHAYDGFVEKGRGVLEIQKTRDAINVEDMKFEFSYTAYDDIAADVDADTAKLIREYAPDVELVVQYQRGDDDTHTLLVKTPPGASYPKLISLLNGFSVADLFAEFGFNENKMGYGFTYPKPGTRKN
jgi:hypothetical protein